MVENMYFLYSLQLKCLGMTHHRNFRDFSACDVHILVLLKNKTAAFFPNDILNLNLNSLLVKRQIDNPSPGAVTGGN